MRSGVLRCGIVDGPLSSGRRAAKFSGTLFFSVSVLKDKRAIFFGFLVSTFVPMRDSKTRRPLT